MKFQSQNLLFLMVCILTLNTTLLSISLMPKYVTTRVNTFMVKEEIAALTAEQQKNGWLLDELETQITYLKKSNDIQPIEANPHTCWDLLVPEPSEVCIKELEHKLTECNNAHTVNEWHTKLNHLERFAAQLKHPKSQQFLPLLKEARKNPFKKFLCFKYITPVLTALGVIGYLAIKRFGLSPALYEDIKNQVNEFTPNSAPQVDNDIREQIATGKINVTTLPAKKVVIRNDFTPENLKKTVELKDPFFGTVFKTIHEMPDSLNVSVNKQPMIENNDIKNNHINLEIPAGQDSLQVEVEYDFVWNNPKKFERYSGFADTIKWVLGRCGINRELLDEVVVGRKIVVYQLGRHFNEATISIAGWAGRGHRLKTRQETNNPDLVPSRDDLFQIDGVRKIGDRVVSEDITVNGRRSSSPNPLNLFET